MSLQSLSPTVASLKLKLEQFVNTRCIPAEQEYENHISQFAGQDRWSNKAVPPIMDILKREAQELGFWNLFLPHRLPHHLIDADSIRSSDGSINISPSMYLTNREYGILCEVMGRSSLAPEACNCSAPDTGNMEVL